MAKSQKQFTLTPEGTAGRRVIVTFEVEKAWKEKLPQTFTMHAQISSTACEGFWRGMEQVGNRLLVYAQKVPGGYWKRYGRPPSLPDNQTVWKTHGCLRNQVLDEQNNGKEDLDFLNRQPQPQDKGVNKSVKMARAFIF